MSERFEGMWSNPEHEDRVLLLEVIAESVRANRAGKWGQWWWNRWFWLRYQS